MYTHHAQVLSNDIDAAPDVAALVGFSQRLPAVLVQMVQNGVASGDAVYTLSQCGQAITSVCWYWRRHVLAAHRFPMRLLWRVRWGVTSKAPIRIRITP